MCARLRLRMRILKISKSKGTKRVYPYMQMRAFPYDIQYIEIVCRKPHDVSANVLKARNPYARLRMRVRIRNISKSKDK